MDRRSLLQVACASRPLRSWPRAQRPPRRIIQSRLSSLGPRQGRLRARQYPESLHWHGRPRPRDDCAGGARPGAESVSLGGATPDMTKSRGDEKLRPSAQCLHQHHAGAESDAQGLVAGLHGRREGRRGAARRIAVAGLRLSAPVIRTRHFRLGDRRQERRQPLHVLAHIGVEIRQARCWPAQCLAGGSWPGCPGSLPTSTMSS